MWSEPFLKRCESTGEEVWPFLFILSLPYCVAFSVKYTIIFLRKQMAILLMDTQGMFDNETTMTLTAQIFGMSTMISSFQIYNVQNRIQEVYQLQ